MKVIFSIAAAVLLFSWHPRHQIKESSIVAAPAFFGKDTPGIVNALVQVNGTAFVKAGLSGKNVKIGIIDAGFYNADADSTLHMFFSTGRAPYARDYIYPGDARLYAKNSDMDWHGTQVWSLIGGSDPTGLKYGLATDASFFLARTDDGGKEYSGEQDNFRKALSWLKSQKVRLVSTSLGYNYGFDNPSENYVPDDMNGNTTIISRAAEEAILEDSMIIVASAGNEGDNAWKILSAPADAKDVIAVGATDENRNKRELSSEGPDFLTYLKPNISCYNYKGGTSFSAPVITGMIACMLQKDPRLTSASIMSLLEKSGHLYPYGNNYEGYGVPDAARILQLMDDPNHDFKKGRKIIATDNTVSIPLDKSENELTLFHKKDDWVVLEQKKISALGNPFVLTRPGEIVRSKLIVDDKTHEKYHIVDKMEKVMRTTVVSGDRVYEIIWP